MAFVPNCTRPISDSWARNGCTPPMRGMGPATPPTRSRRSAREPSPGGKGVYGNDGDRALPLRIAVRLPPESPRLDLARRRPGRGRVYGERGGATPGGVAYAAPPISEMEPMSRVEDYAIIGDLHTAAMVAWMAPSTGCVCRGSTHQRVSRPWSGPGRTGTGVSRPPAPPGARAGHTATAP